MTPDLLQWLEDQANILSPSELVAATFFALQMNKYGKSWCSRAQKHFEKPNFETDPTALIESKDFRSLALKWLQQRHFRHVIANAQTSMEKLITGEWNAFITHHIPTPLEVLTKQIEGLRVVTVLTKKNRVFLPVLEKEDALHFMLHDLEHLYKFEFDQSLKQQQIQLAQMIMQAYQTGHYHEFLKDPQFQKKFDYVASDMNTHPLHGLKFMKAMYLEYLLRTEGEGATLLSDRNEMRYDEIMHELSDLWSFEVSARKALVDLNKRSLSESEVSHIMNQFN